MNNLINLFFDQFQEFAVTHPAPAIVAVVFGVIFISVFVYLRTNYFLREKSISLSEKRFAPLLSILKKENLASINPLRLELVFHRAYGGRRLNFDELMFALAHRNTSNILFDIRHGHLYVRLNSSRLGYEILSKHWLSLRLREKLAGYIACGILSPAILFVSVYAFFEPAIGLTFLFELGCFFWGMMVLTRSLACAQRLLALAPLAQLNANGISSAGEPIKLVEAKGKRATVKRRASSEKAGSSNVGKEDGAIAA